MVEKQRVYCAGPMFSPGDKYEQTNIAEMLEKAGFQTFLPQRDGIELKSVMQKLNDPGMLATVMLFLPVLRHAVFALDLYQVLAWSDCIVFNMNGRTPGVRGPCVPAHTILLLPWAHAPAEKPSATLSFA